jgi:curved DNA-binding protein CbpA
MNAPVQTTEQSLAEHVRERQTGILTIADGKVRRLFCLKRGRLVHAASNLIEEQLEAFLAREGHSKAEEGDVTPIEASALHAHAAELLLTALGSRTPQVTFQEGTPNLKGKALTDLDPRETLLEFLREHPKNPREIRSRLGNIAMHPVRVTTMEAEIKRLAIEHPVVDEIWQRCDGDLTILQLAGAISCGQDPALRTLYGMQLIGSIEMMSRKARSERRVEDVPVTRNELMMRLERAIDNNHYGVLEVGALADEDEIRSSYYQLARRYHPDRFRSGDLGDLLPRIEAYFSQVTEGYNTLADPELRKKYDQELLDAEQTTKEEPGHDSSHLARQNYTAAKALIKRGELRKAIKFLENAIDLEENVPEYHVEFGSVIARNPVRREEAEEHLRRGLELDPTVLAAHTALADVLVKREKPTNAIQILNEALKWFPDHPDIKQRLKELGVGESRGLFGR